MNRKPTRRSFFGQAGAALAAPFSATAAFAGELEGKSFVVGSRAAFDDANAIRVLQPAWQRDGLNIGGMCVAFVQPGASDVQLRGSNVCVLAGNCEQMIGCGVVQ